jgi:hypothetical protein
VDARIKCRKVGWTFGIVSGLRRVSGAGGVILIKLKHTYLVDVVLVTLSL